MIDDGITHVTNFRNCIIVIVVVVVSALMLALLLVYLTDLICDQQQQL